MTDLFVSRSANLPYVTNVQTINSLPYPYSRYGDVCLVDAVNGSDAIASQNGYPYKSVNAAVSNSTAGSTVWVMPGTYTLSETLNLHSNTCLRGLNTQTCILQLCNVVSNTTLINMSAQTRIEDLTMILQSAADVSLTGLYYPSGTSLNSKLRTAVLNVFSDANSSNTVLGLHSPGTSATTYSSSSAVRACTINVSAASTGIIRGLLVDGPNRFATRDTNIICTGNAINSIGVETTNISAFAELKTSTIGGELYDINRSRGDIQLGFTDLIHNSANGNSFSAVIEGSTTFFGIIGNLTTNTSYNVVPGSSDVNFLPDTPFRVPVTQNMILYVSVIQFTGVLDVGQQLHFDVHRNNIVAPVYTISMGSGETSKVNRLTSADFDQGDTYYGILRTVGNPESGTFTATLGFY
jgi:hypothetical protein